MLYNGWLGATCVMIQFCLGLSISYLHSWKLEESWNTPLLHISVHHV